MQIHRRTIRRGPHGSSRVLLIAAVAAVAVAGAGIVAVVLRDGEDSASPTAIAAEFTAAWSKGDADTMRSLTVERRPTLVDQLDGWTAGLRIEEQRHEVIGDQDASADGAAQVAVRSTYTLAGLGEWTYDHPLTLREVDDDTDRDWAIEWGPTTVHPDLRADQRLRTTRIWPERAPILGVDDQVIAGPHEAVVVGVEPQRITDRAALNAALQQALGLDPAQIDRAIDAPGVQPDHFVALVTVRRPEYEAVRDQIYDVPGTVFRETTARGAPTPEFARHVIGRVGEITAARLDELGGPYAVGDTVGLSGLEAQYETQLAGTPSGTVEIVDDAGTVAVLHRVSGTEPQPVRTTIDPAVQAAVEETIGDREDPLAIVVVDAANNVRAVASRPLGDVNRALSGQYPPGSTFKVVTAAALLDHGLTPDTTVDCPGTLVVDGREFTNFESDALGPVPFEEAFVQSCNTAFISAADALADGALVSAADRFGFNTDYTVGAPVAASRVPEPEGATERAASAIGQAGILATPLHMATVAATVIDGTWKEPTLVIDSDDDPAGTPTSALDPAHRATIDAFMTGVVERGTATAARSAAGLRGKTGTAEFGTETPPRTHAWFIGYRNDLAAAILLEDGGVGGQHAAPVAGDLFSRLITLGR